MKMRGKKKLASIIKMGVAMVGMLGTMVLSNVEVARAEKIIHTHIWATKYNENKHWEYCTVCNEIRNEHTHNMVDNWEYGYESCHQYNGNNFSTRICECGYSYVYRKPHTKCDTWYSTGARLMHYRKCSTCNDWTQSGRCANANGYLSCKNTGTCSTCGVQATKDYHYITKDGKCRDCGKKFFDITPYTITYDKDYKTATIKFTFKPVVSKVEFTGTMGAYCGNANYTSNKWTFNKHSDGSIDYTGVYTFDSSKQRKSTLNFMDRTGAIKINGVGVYADGNLMKMEIWQDHTKPEVNEVKQVDQKTHRNWATIKELTISGKENLSKIVTISILDKQTKDVIVNKAKTTVKDGKYTYKCTPPLEGPETGRDYILKVEDEIGNLTEKTFTVYRTDCRAPLIRSSKEYTEWSKTKNLALELTDYGAGSPATSLSDQVSYKNATKQGDKYIASYKFAEDKYDVSEYALYLRDGLGNATKEIIKVGKVDNTKPTVTDVKGEVIEIDRTINTTDPTTGTTTDNVTGATQKTAILTVTANDMNTTLNAEGSGVAGYALTKTKDEPKAEEWQESNQLAVTEAGTYYLWVKDAVGNIADITVINVKEDLTSEVTEEKIEYDNGEEEIGEAISEVVDKNNTGNKDDMDATPKTGDTTQVALALGILLVSGIIIMIVVGKRRKRA